MRSQEVHLVLSAALVAKIDERARSNFTTRSQYMREAVVTRLKQEQMPAAPKNRLPQTTAEDELLKRYGII